jgi:hypothetical protein
VVHCDDGNPDVHPGARELCNARDDDCSPESADGLGDCAGLLCNGGQCLSSCSTNAECLEGLECAGTSCSGKLEAGASCGRNAHCETGVCRASLCAQAGQLGQVCDETSDCAESLGCVSGTCRKNRGQSCTENNQCGSRACVCADANCTAKACAPQACASCRFDANADGTCEGALADGKPDPAGDCESCNGLASCNKNNGEVCSSGPECTSNQCGCSDDTCSQRKCIALGCASCTFFNGTACSALRSGEADPPNCSGNAACSSGVCTAGKGNGLACASDGECVSKRCVPQANGGKQCQALPSGRCDTEIDCQWPGCTWDCGACKVTTQECKSAYGPVGCTADDQCVNYCEIDEGECYSGPLSVARRPSLRA